MALDPTEFFNQIGNVILEKLYLRIFPNGLAHSFVFSYQNKVIVTGFAALDPERTGYHFLL